MGQFNARCTSFLDLSNVAAKTNWVIWARCFSVENCCLDASIKRLIHLNLRLSISTVAIRSGFLNHYFAKTSSKIMGGVLRSSIQAPKGHGISIFLIAPLQSRPMSLVAIYRKTVINISHMPQMSQKLHSPNTDCAQYIFGLQLHLVSFSDPISAEAGHKFLAKRPGKKIDQKQKNMNRQLTSCVRLQLLLDGMERELAELEAVVAAARAAGNNEEEEAAHRACGRVKAKTTGNITFLASAETVRLRSGQLIGRVPSSSDRWVLTAWSSSSKNTLSTSLLT